MTAPVLGIRYDDVFEILSPDTRRLTGRLLGQDANGAISPSPTTAARTEP